MSASSHAASPFDMLINPQAILHAIEQSEHLQRLSRKICRPLDRQSAPSGTDDASALDKAVEDSGDSDEI